MEIYHLKLRWLGFIFVIPVIWMSLAMAGYTSYESKGGGEDTAGYVVIGVCLLVALQCFMGSTRFYFDNVAGCGIQVRKHFYGEKTINFPYSSILGVVVRCYRRGNKGSLVYRIGITEQTTIFGQNAKKFTALRSFSGKEGDRLNAKDFAKEICLYTKLKFIDDSDIVRQESSSHGSSHI